MINDDKRVLEHFDNILAKTKNNEKVEVYRQNIKYLVDKLKRCFALEKENQQLKAENEILSSALHDARHEIRVLKSKLERKNSVIKYYADEIIYDSQYKLDIMRDSGDRAKRELSKG